MARCGDCIHFHQCSHYVTPEETFAEVGGCSAFKNKGDFVEVVRCKDCKYYSKMLPNGGVIYKFPICQKFCKSTETNDFCSYGERKDNA